MALGSAWSLWVGGLWGGQRHVVKTRGGGSQIGLVRCVRKPIAFFMVRALYMESVLRTRYLHSTNNV